jgi:subtilisin family serine protease
MKIHGNSVIRRFYIAALVLVLVWALPPAVFAANAPGEALVVLKNKTGEIGARSRSASEGFARNVALSVGARADRTYAALSASGDSVFVLLKSDTKSAEELLADLKNNPDVISASPNYRVHALLAPNDPYYRSGALWGMDRINAPAAWDVTVGDENVCVAVMDSGITRGHEDLAGNVSAYSRNFTKGEDGDQFGHGTHVSGIIGAAGNNEKGVAGVNWRTKVLMLKVLDEDGSGLISWQVEAVNYLIDLLEKNPGLRIPAVNLSLGGAQALTPEEQIGSPYWLALKTLDRLNKMVIVVAAGNDAFEVGAPAQYNVMDDNGDILTEAGDYAYPASMIGIDNLIVVGSIDGDGAASYFSNWSSKYVHMIAPGGEILSAYNDGGYFSLSGTSMSTPHVAGAAALLASRYPTWNAAQLKSHLLLTSNRDVNPETKGVTIKRPIVNLPINHQIAGDYKLSKYGLLDVGKAVTETPRENIPAGSVTLVPRKTVDMEAGQTEVLGAVVSPEEATDKKLTWTSSDPSVAAVNENGIVTARAAGSAVIVASASSGVQDDITVRVSSEASEPARASGGGCDGGSLGVWAGVSLTAVCFAGAAARKKR